MKPRGLRAISPGRPTSEPSTSWTPLAGEIPTTTIDRERVAGGLDLVELLVEAGITKSKGEARRVLGQRGIYVNDVQIDGDRTISTEDLLHDRFVMLRKGKSQRHLSWSIAPAT